MKSQWELLKKKLSIIKSKSILLEIDADYLNYINNNLLKNSIDGLPFILIFKKGKIIKKYNGNRNFYNMFKFFKSFI